jgi:acyl dehydratase
MAQITSAAAQRHKRGGLYFEDFVVGELHEHRYTRTVTQMDNMLFSNMTLNPQPLSTGISASRRPSGGSR